MKQLFSLVLAGMIGGLITLGGMYLLEDDASRPVDSIPVREVNYLNQSPGAVPFDFKEAAARAMPAVVHISSHAPEQTAQVPDEKEEEDPDESNPFRFFFGDDFFRNPFGDNIPQEGSGSGVIYSTDGYIVTNNHVVESAGRLEVTLYDNRTFTATVVGTYPKSDLAVVKIDASGLPTMDVADSDQAEIGEWVLAVGNPFDLNSTVTAGIISAKGRSIHLLGGDDAIESFIQTDAAVNPGNSGGALVDYQGRLLGINTAIATRTGVFQGYSFAIPVNLVRRIADDIIEHGSFRRAFLGVRIAELDSEYASELGLEIAQGVVIEELIDGGSAQYAGLLPKDVITSVNGREIRGVPELQEIIGRAQIGDVLNLTVYRRGGKTDIPVQLKASE